MFLKVLSCHGGENSPDVSGEKGRIDIDPQTEEKVAGILGLLGLLTGLISAINQVLRLWQWRTEEQEKASQPSLEEELKALETQVRQLTTRLELLQKETAQRQSSSQ